MDVEGDVASLNIEITNFKLELAEVKKSQDSQDSSSSASFYMTEMAPGMLE